MYPVYEPGLLVDDRVPVGGAPALGLGSSLVSHASKYSRKNDLTRNALNDPFLSLSLSYGRASPYLWSSNFHPH
ncbi:hypothetical protein GBA52_015449 [Prunus armeniaca]|nr:hypothetical protein GBA52_015449 [Prunus armeniaca]